MSYDLNILCFNQEKPTKFKLQSDIIIKNEVVNKDISRYHSIWPFMTSMNGIWYSLVKEDNGVFNAFSICDINDEISEEDIPIPYWIEEEEVIYNLTPLKIYEQYFSEFEMVVKCLIQQSPIKTIMILARYQGGEHEIVNGVFSTNEFFRLLKLSKILFNTCYIIRE